MGFAYTEISLISLLENPMTTTLRSFFRQSAIILSTSLAFCGSASAHLLTTKITADNSFVAYLSASNTTQGTQFSSGTSWGTVYGSYIALGSLDQYYLHISATDAGGVAGLLGEFSLAGSGYHFANNTTSLLTGSNLVMANTTGYANAYSATTSYGLNNASRTWGTVNGISNNAQWVWSGNNDTNNFSFFSVAILKDTPANVPEPGSIGLLGLGLLALSRFAKKPK
jgi:hypothetical protein